MLVTTIAAGMSITDTARALGVDRRTIAYWRWRAYSRDPRDRPYVELERRLQETLIERAARPWEQLARGIDPLVDFANLAAPLDPARFDFGD